MIIWRINNNVVEFYNSMIGKCDQIEEIFPLIDLYFRSLMKKDLPQDKLILKAGIC
jgi:hypothetical protein